MTNSLSFYTPVQFEGPASCKQKVLESCDDYFYLEGRAACVIPGNIVNNSQAVKIKKLSNPTFANTLLCVIKVITYMTIIIPLLMLTLKACLRSSEKFHVVGSKKSSNANDGSAVGVPVKNVISNHHGAGVLPYAMIKGQLHFLLSKEGYGSDKDTWCEFGGAKDANESPRETAARECWEESRGVLGDLKEIAKKIAKSPSIGNHYEMFFMKVDQPQNITSAEFLKRTFTVGNRMEKTKIAWVKAEEVYKSVKAYRPGGAPGQLLIDGASENPRKFFAKLLNTALRNPQGNAVLANL